MIFKQIDDKAKEIQTLNILLEKSQSTAQKKLINTQLQKVTLGIEAEEENAYYLNFEFEKSENIILLHDIRLEHKGRTAQLDHILISRFGIELLETKSSKGVMTINNDGSMTLVNGKYTNTYPNPLEQSKRHASVLKEFISNSNILSKRIDMFGGIDISSKVLIHPKTNVSNSELPSDFERGDSFVSNRLKDIDDIGLFKAVGMITKGYDIDKAKEIAKLLVVAHTPIEYDYEKKFRIKKEVKSQEETKIKPSLIREENAQVKNEKQICPRCKEGQLIIKKIKSKKAQEKYSNTEFFGCNRYPKCRYTQDIV